MKIYSQLSDACFRAAGEIGYDDDQMVASRTQLSLTISHMKGTKERQMKKQSEKAQLAKPNQGADALSQSGKSTIADQPEKPAVITEDDGKKDEPPRATRVTRNRTLKRKAAEAQENTIDQQTENAKRTAFVAAVSAASNQKPTTTYKKNSLQVISSNIDKNYQRFSS